MSFADAPSPILPAPRADTAARARSQSNVAGGPPPFANLLEGARTTAETAARTTAQETARPTEAAKPVSSTLAAIEPIEASAQAPVALTPASQHNLDVANLNDTIPSDDAATPAINPLLAGLIVPEQPIKAASPAALPTNLPVDDASSVLTEGSAPSDLEAAPVPNISPAAAAAPVAVPPQTAAASDTPAGAEADKAAPASATPVLAAQPTSKNIAAADAAPASGPAPEQQQTPQVASLATAQATADPAATAAASAPIVSLTGAPSASTPGAERAATRADAGTIPTDGDAATASGKTAVSAASSQTTLTAQAGAQTANGQTSNGQSSNNQASQLAAKAVDALTADGGSSTTQAQSADALLTARNPLGEAARPGATSQMHPALRQAPEAAVQVYTRFVERFDGRAQKFEMRLDPAELGRVDIRIEIGADKRVQAVLAAHDSGALSDLMRGQKALERALADAGIDLADGGLTFELSSESGGSAGNGQTSAEDARELAHSWRGFGAVSVPVEADAASVATPRRWGASRLNLVA